ncbi:DoxX family protein [Chitinophaga sedimenti]|uniref:DoxX family protein n=1 Tax=Chitinophaga sedimenti TaxID=2033606 RepID=UPI00200556CF|nr:DoxX family protein [Chitinophaga sedimenti]MCK7555301.1 DoxX family protein [Chitinophaga sedimenti]
MLQRIDRWGQSHHPRWIDAFRMLLGLLLIAKGIQFIGNIDQLNATIRQNPFFSVMSMWLAHYIVFAHLCGGILITMGLLTRVAVLANIPVLLGALIFIQSATPLFNVHTDLWLTLVVLAALLFFMVEGSGPISVDHYMATHPEKKADTV